MFPLSVNLVGGIRGVPITYIERVQVMGASHFCILRRVLMSAALPNMFTGLFMGFCNSLTSLVTAEVLGVQFGLGLYLQNAESYTDNDIVFCIVLTFVIIAFLMITILSKVQKHAMKWSKGTIEW